ncbi:MAG: hypothetical protein JXA60_13420 [Candidatus Coatesbacteria bacterium]|nr:hypothetical protein [Candidatus Coatesbacteria bacterium]
MYLALILFYSFLGLSFPDGQDIELFIKARVLEQQGKNQEAVLIYDNLSRKHKSLEIELRIIDNYELLKKLTEAIERANKAIEKFPKEEKLYIKLGSMLQIMNDQKAIEVYEKGISRTENNDSLYTLLSNLYKSRGEFNSSLSVLKRQLKSTNFKPVVLYNLGDISYKLKLRKEALKYWNEAYKTGDRSPRLLGALFEINRNDPASLKYLYEINPKTNRLMTLILAEQLRLKQYEDALKMSLDIHRNNPDIPEIKGAIINVVYFMLKDKKDNDKIKLLEDIIKKGFYEQRFLDYLILLYSKQDNWAQEERIHMLFIKKYPDLAYGYNNLGYRYVEKNIKLGEAEVLIKKALEMEPNNGNYFDSLAMLYIRLGKPDEAKVAFNKALNFSPENWEIYYHYSEFLKIQGKTNEAMEMKQKGDELKKRELKDKTEIEK